MSNIIISNRYLAERQFGDPSFSRKSFSRFDILPNVFVSNLHSAECHFPESRFSRTSFSRKCIERNEHHYLIKTWLWLLWLFIRNSYGLLKNTVSIRKITKCSAKWRSAIRRFGKITFGWTMIRKNVVWHYEVSVIRRFGYLTTRWNYMFGDFFLARHRFDEMTFWENSDSVKWRFRRMIVAAFGCYNNFIIIKLNIVTFCDVSCVC